MEMYKLKKIIKHNCVNWYSLDYVRVVVKNMADYMAIFSVTTVIALLALIQFNDAESIETLLDFKNMYVFINCYVLIVKILVDAVSGGHRWLKVGLDVVCSMAFTLYGVLNENPYMAVDVVELGIILAILYLIVAILELVVTYCYASRRKQ